MRYREHFLPYPSAVKSSSLMGVTAADPESTPYGLLMNGENTILRNYSSIYIELRSTYALYKDTSGDGFQSRLMRQCFMDPFEMLAT